MMGVRWITLDEARELWPDKDDEQLVEINNMIKLKKKPRPGKPKPGC